MTRSNQSGNCLIESTAIKSQNRHTKEYRSEATDVIEHTATTFLNAMGAGLLIHGISGKVSKRQKLHLCRIDGVSVDKQCGTISSLRKKLA
jgi:hypothetical protein